MDSDYKKMTGFLVGLGIEEIAHTEKTYLGHLVALHRLLESDGCPEDVCRAGMFHSIYGTELFQGFKLPLERRSEVRALIGERAERLAYWNCVMDRASLDACVGQADGPYRIQDRITGEPIELDRRDFDDLCRIHLFDLLEQVARARRWDYRRAAYRGMATRLGGSAEAFYQRTFAGENAAASTH